MKNGAPQIYGISLHPHPFQQFLDSSHSVRVSSKCLHFPSVDLILILQRISIRIPQLPVPQPPPQNLSTSALNHLSSDEKMSGYSDDLDLFSLTSLRTWQLHQTSALL